MNDDRLSAYLDDELDPSERAELERELAVDDDLAATLGDLRRIRELLRGVEVDPGPATLSRISAAVAADDVHRRRGVPVWAAVAAAVVIIAGVVVGVGDTGTVPAIGSFVAQHRAAAVALGPDATLHDDPMGLDEIPMDEAMAAAPDLPGGMSMVHAFGGHDTVQMVYVDDTGEAVSVFRIAGEVDMATLGDGQMSHPAAGTMWSADTDDAAVAVIDGSGYVWVVVSATHHDDMMEMMGAHLPTRSPSLRERMAELLAPLRFWD